MKTPSAAAADTGTPDSITAHTIAVNLLCCLASRLWCCGNNNNSPPANNVVATARETR